MRVMIQSKVLRHDFIACEACCRPWSVLGAEALGFCDYLPFSISPLAWYFWFTIPSLGVWLKLVSLHAVVWGLTPSLGWRQGQVISIWKPSRALAHTTISLCLLITYQNSHCPLLINRIWNILNKWHLTYYPNSLNLSFFTSLHLSS